MGVMKYVGKAMRDNDVGNVPCIGIASHNKVMQQDALTRHSQAV